MIMALQWPDEHKDRFMVLKDSARAQGVSGYAFASVSDITDMVSDNAYQAAIGEDGSPFQVWRLTDDGPVPAKVTTKRHAIPDNPTVEVIITWRLPVGGRRAEIHTESGYYPAIEV